MVGTVGAARRSDRRGALAAASVAHLAGLLSGGALAFGLLGAAGELLQPGRPWLATSGAVCAVAALADGCGLRVRPQIPLQVPERWRRTLPLPLAVLLYGGLIGTGLATAVPATAAWALVPAVVALGSLAGGLVVGLAFALGRALPVLALVRSSELRLAEGPGVLRGVRLAAAVALAVAAASCLAGTARAGSGVVHGYDPSADGRAVAWTATGARGYLQLAGKSPVALKGTNPAVGGGLIAWRRGSVVSVAPRTTLRPFLAVPVPGVRQLALTDQWLVARVVAAGGTTSLLAVLLADTDVRRVIASARPPEVLGRPSISGTTVVFPLTSRDGSSIVEVSTLGGPWRVVRDSLADQLLAPSLVGLTLLYLDVSRCTQRLLLGGLVGTTGRVLVARSATARADAGHEPGHTTQGEHRPCGSGFRPGTTVLWTTALTQRRAYVTELRLVRSGLVTPMLVGVSR
jgi:hypothetical protein